MGSMEPIAEGIGPSKDDNSMTIHTDKTKTRYAKVRTMNRKNDRKAKQLARGLR